MGLIDSVEIIKSDTQKQSLFFFITQSFCQGFSPPKFFSDLSDKVSVTIPYVVSSSMHRVQYQEYTCWFLLRYGTTIFVCVICMLGASWKKRNFLLIFKDWSVPFKCHDDGSHAILTKAKAQLLTCVRFMKKILRADMILYF